MVRKKTGPADMPLAEGSFSFAPDESIDRLIAISSRVLGYVALVVVLASFVLVLTEIF